VSRMFPLEEIRGDDKEVERQKTTRRTAASSTPRNIDTNRVMTRVKDPRHVIAMDRVTDARDVIVMNRGTDARDVIAMDRVTDPRDVIEMDRGTEACLDKGRGRPMWSAPRGHAEQ